MQYRSEATSVEGFVQQIACCYLRHGYWFYVTGRIPDRKDPLMIDAKLIEKYGITSRKWERARRKQRGLANMQYIRFQNWFLLLSTEGHHPFKQQERIRDCRRNPIRFEGYSISYRRGGITPSGGGPPKWHACVRIDPTTYQQLKTYFVMRAKHRKSETLVEDFRRIPFARYAPVRRQILNIHRAVNHARKQAGFEKIPVSSLSLRRKITQPFGKESTNIREVA